MTAIMAIFARLDKQKKDVAKSKASIHRGFFIIFMQIILLPTGRFWQKLPPYI
ncbi:MULTISPECIES: hypothetical protein [Acinetobacter]|uniref:Uncharacterized protein n=1 Tax=Acinetobacter piscicola TaxID=2006115 RepID=A0A7S6VTD6_9GAMM|nr:MULTISPECIES: hypothetical protein [Acinetobacter]MDM1759306.1 hypothetical protein [Acinetobacter sp. 251-1]QOW44415.1 hypothetical protein G0028_05130 [Acinetobacter piscicola]